MPTPAPSAPSVSSVSGSYPGLAEYMGLELTEAEVRANMPEYLPAVPQVHSNRYRNLFPLKLSIASIFPLNRAAALPLSLGLALLPPFRVWALAWQKHRWRITKNILKSQRACSRWTTGWGRLSSARMEMEKLDSGWKPSTKVPPDLAQDCFHLCRAGVFVCLVTKGSPAALGGLRFGDQLLQVDGVNLAGFSSDKVRYYLSTYKASLLHCTMHIVRCTTCWKRPRWTT